MVKYYCLNPIAKVGLDGFNENYQKVDNYKDADVALVRSENMHDLEIPEKLLAVARAGAGVNNIPLDDLAKKGVVVFNTPGANANGVKELVIAGMLLASRDIVGGINWAKTQKDNPNIAKEAEKQKSLFAGNEIRGKKLGIIGLGAIGVLVANAAAHLGMDVLGYDPYISVEAAWNLSRGVKHIEAIEEIYQQCDFISIHAPLLEDTRQMVNKEAFDLMKKDVVILNFARADLVNESDLLIALNDGKIKRYVTDFPNPTIANADNVIVIPHLGASTSESEDNCAKMAVRRLKRYMEYGIIKNSVNYPTCDMGLPRGESRIAIHHKNIKNMIAPFATIFTNANINITNMMNRSKGDFAYSLFDLETKVSEAVVKELESIEGVFKVRVIK